VHCRAEGRHPAAYLLWLSLPIPPHSRRSWVTFASLCVTSRLPANSPSASWRPRTWRKWTWEDCQVRRTEPGVRCCIALTALSLDNNAPDQCDTWPRAAGPWWDAGAWPWARPLARPCSAHVLTPQRSPRTSSRSPPGLQHWRHLLVLCSTATERALLLPSASSTFLALLSFFFFRSLRENQPAAEWKEAEEEEDDSEEEHFESVLQWVLQLWDSYWPNAGKDKDYLVKII